MATYKLKKSRKMHPVSRVIIGTMCLLGIGGGCLYTIERYNQPELVGKWVSTETGDVVGFNENGTLSLNDSTQMSTYKILSPNQLLYNIEDKQFEMYYNLEGRILTWGLSVDTVETFKRH
ncbi:MAG: hypothetical protein RR448_12285 [Niameybacter sp.]|uniref:hypothetical protein n=1 Tax=Niameybacter sp. TaxID=2033640 RepID=UPI002FC70936